MHDGNPELDAGVVEQVAAREVVGAVDDDVVARDDVDDVGGVEARVVGDDVDVGIEHREGLLGRVDLAIADAIDVVQHLALQVRRVDLVHVDDAERADARRGEIERGGRAEATRTEQQHLRLEKFHLTGDADLGQQQMPLVAVALLRGERRRLRPRAPLVLPAAEAALHRGDVGVSQFGEGLRGERRANAARAVGDDRRTLVGDASLDLRLEMAAGDVDRVGQGALFVLVGFAHVEHDRSGGDPLGGGAGVDLDDLGLGGGEEVTERCHAETLPSHSGIDAVLGISVRGHRP